jgi:hypothetical protein
MTPKHFQVGVADVFIVKRVGIAIKAVSAHTHRFPYKGAVAERCSIPTVTWGMATNTSTFQKRYILVDPGPSRFGSHHRSTPERWRSGMFGPAVCSSAVVCRVRASVMQRSAHDSGCRLARGLDVHPYVSASAVTAPEGQEHDGAVVGPARSAVRGPACIREAHGPARGAVRVSPKKPSRSRPVERPGWPVNGT